MEPNGEKTLQVMKEAVWYNEWLFSFLKPYLNGKTILEVGAGIGNFTGILKNYGKVTSIDYEEKYIKLLKKKGYANVCVGFGDIERGKYFFKKEKFDVIICLNVLEHVKNDEKALKNMLLLLKKKGKVILLVPAHRQLYSKFDREIGHFRRYTLKDVEDKIKSAGFRRLESRYFNWVSALGWFLFLKLTKNKSLPAGNVKLFDLFGKFLLWPEKYIKPPFGLSVLAIAEI